VKSWQKNVVLTVALLASGAARMPYEVGLSKELRTAGLAPLPLEIETRDKIGQTSSAVALGGLRTLVATFLNLRAFGFFQEQRWDDVADTFDTIVALAPRTEYYWDTGSWHMAYNAASYYLYDSKLPPLRRREAWRASILKGRAFLERGIRNNPDDWKLYANLGFLLTDENKFMAFRDRNEAFTSAADAYQKAIETGNALDYVRRSRLYALARVEGREKDSLALARSLYSQTKNRTPTLLMLLLVLEAYENPSMDVSKRAVELFGTEENAYEALSTHWRRTKEGFPVYGIAAGLKSLEKSLSIPADKSIFKNSASTDSN
jgi:hypothetical protein